MTAFRTDINGKELSRRPKDSMIEVVEPNDEEEEEVHKQDLTRNFRL